MRITYIHQYYRTPRMSGGTRSYEFARRLAADGNSVHVITSAPVVDMPSSASGWTVTRDGGVTVHWFGIEYSNALGVSARLRSFGEFLLRASWRALQVPTDLVFATSTPLTVAVPAILVSAVRGVPMVFEVRDVWPAVPIAMGYLKNPLSRHAALALETLAYRCSAHVVALSPDMARSIATRYPGTPISVIPNSSDIDLFAVGDDAAAAVRVARPRIGNRPLLLYVGTFGPANDVSYLVEMAAEMAEIAPEVQFLLVGDGKEVERVRALADRRGVLDRTLSLEPAVPKKEIPALVAAADMTLSVFAPLPALGANSPNKVFDSFAAGRPVMINNGGWLADVLEEAGAGVVAPAGRPHEAARIVAQRLSDPVWMASARESAFHLATGQFDRDLLARRLGEILVSTRQRSRSRRLEVSLRRERGLMPRRWVGRNQRSTEDP